MDHPQALSSSVERLFDLSSELLGIATVGGYFSSLNASWAKSLGWTNEVLMAQPYINFVHPDDVQDTLALVSLLTIPGAEEVHGFENRYRTSRGTYRWFSWKAAAHGSDIYFAARDITSEFEDRASALLQEETLIESQDFVKALTDSVAEGIFAIDHHGRPTYLNSAAQRMLGWTAEELRGTKIHEVIHFERLDGSELAIRDCPIVNTVEHGETIRVERDVFIRRDGSRLPVSYSSSPLHSEGSIGSVVVFDDISLRLADELRAERELDKLSWIGRVQDALANEQFVLYAQPIMNLATGEIDQHELLLRMRDERGGVVLPGRFLPAAEEFGLILDVDRWVVQQSVLLAAAGHKVEFNLSVKSLGLGMVNTIAEMLRTSGAPPENLVCEITETAIMNDNVAGEMFVQGIRDLGCKIALDDFGVGYGGLAYLKRLPVSFLKIDIQFVSDLKEMEASRHVVRAIVDLARSFGAQTIAEGAEDEETVNILKGLGVDYVQGFFIAYPSPVERVLGPRSNSNKWNRHDDEHE